MLGFHDTLVRRCFTTQTRSMALFVYTKENNILLFSPNDAPYCAAGRIHGDAMSHFYHLSPTTVLSTVSTGHH